MTDTEMPLIPEPGYVVAELVEITFFTEKGLQVAGGRGTPIMRILAVGHDVAGWKVGDYFVTHPNNSELSWCWTDPMPLQVLKADVICARIDTDIMEKMLDRMEKFSTPVKPPESPEPAPKVESPPKKKIILPEDADLPPQL